MKIYETYGFGNDVNLLKICINRVPTSVNKPTKAWWGSPVDGNFTWKYWCLGEKFKPESYFRKENKFLWTLTDDSKIFTIKNVSDAENIGKSYQYNSLNDIPFCISPVIDFEALYDDGYIAIELEDACIGHMFVNKYELMFNSWDCESICVLDSSKIVPVSK